MLLLYIFRFIVFELGCCLYYIRTSAHTFEKIKLIYAIVCCLSEKFEHMKKTGDYYVIVVEDTNLGQIVATATLITEHKFIHSCAKVN